MSGTKKKQRKDFFSDEIKADVQRADGKYVLEYFFVNNKTVAS